MKKIWFPATVILLSFFSIGQSLQFAINGDDWLALYRYNQDFNSFISHLDIRNYITPTSNYVFGYLMMGIISKLFSYNPYPYYLVALILRIITAFSFYFGIYSVTKNKWMGYLSAIFFSSMYAGIETTNWVSNMNTYLSIILINVFLKITFKSESTLLSLRTILQSLILVMSFLVTPVRMHGLLFFVPLTVFFNFGKINRRNILQFLGILSILFIPLIFFRLLTYPNSALDYTKLTPSSNGNIFSVLLNLITNLGSSIIPGILINQDKPENLFNLLGGSFTLLILTTYFFTTRLIYPQYSKLGLLFLFSSISFLIIPGLINPTSVFTSDHRYLIIPASWLMVAFSIFIVTLYLRKNSLLKSLAVLLALAIISLNSIALQQYFNVLSNSGRLAKDSDRIFEFIKNKIPPTNNQAPQVFLFISEDGFFVYNAVNFGFTPHMMVLNPNLAKNPQMAPLTVDNFSSLKSILDNANSPELQRYGYKPVKIPLENVYSFYVDSEKILDYTDQVRKALGDI